MNDIKGKLSANQKLLFKHIHKGLPLHRALLFYGDNGTGKTLTARAFAGEMRGGRCLRFDIRDLTAQHITDIFQWARYLVLQGERIILFFDEAYQFGLPGNQNPKQIRALMAFHNEVRKKKENNNISVITATFKDHDEIDPSFGRGSGFTSVKFELPDEDDRREIFEYLMQKQSHIHSEISYDQVAKETEGCSGRNLEDFIEILAINLADSNNQKTINGVTKTIATNQDILPLIEAEKERFRPRPKSQLKAEFREKLKAQSAAHKADMDALKARTAKSQAETRRLRAEIATSQAAIRATLEKENNKGKQAVGIIGGGGVGTAATLLLLATPAAPVVAGGAIAGALTGWWASS